MAAAVAQLEPEPEYLLVDFVRLTEVNLPQKGIVNGDCLCFSIACASIIANNEFERSDFLFFQVFFQVIQGVSDTLSFIVGWQYYRN